VASSITLMLPTSSCNGVLETTLKVFRLVALSKWHCPTQNSANSNGCHAHFWSWDLKRSHTPQVSNDMKIHSKPAEISRIRCNDEPHGFRIPSPFSGSVCRVPVNRLVITNLNQTDGRKFTSDGMAHNFDRNAKIVGQAGHYLMF
jgi:hypothetical protein